MKKIIAILGMCVFSNFLLAQVTTTKVSEAIAEISNEPYDSIFNFLDKDVYKYVGQELYLKGQSEILRRGGYNGFTIDYTQGTWNKSNVYKCCDGFNSKYDDLVGKYFTVIAVYEHPKANERKYLYGSKYFFELKENKSGDKVYYEYDSQDESSFPFVVVGFFIKQKKMNINKEFIIRGKNWIESTEPMTDINTGLPVSFEPGSKWKCVDLTIEEKYFNLSLILQNEKGERIPLDLDYAHDKSLVFRVEDVLIYKKKFGAENWNKILNGKVNVGFTEEMVLLSWGKPEKINRSSSGDQWVYKGQYLYFRNGKFTSFN